MYAAEGAVSAGCYATCDIGPCAAGVRLVEPPESDASVGDGSDDTWIGDEYA